MLTYRLKEIAEVETKKTMERFDSKYKVFQFNALARKSGRVRWDIQM